MVFGISAGYKLANEYAMRNICESIRERFGVIAIRECTFTEIFLARVETYKVAYPPHRSVSVVVTAMMGKERSKARVPRRCSLASQRATKA